MTNYRPTTLPYLHQKQRRKPRNPKPLLWEQHIYENLYHILQEQIQNKTSEGSLFIECLSLLVISNIAT